MHISRSRTVEPLFPDLVVDHTVVEMVSELIKYFKCHSRLKVSLREASHGNSCFCLENGWYLRKTMIVFRDVVVVVKGFWAFILPVLEYCTPV